jgi:hypothetical protein
MASNFCCRITTPKGDAWFAAQAGDVSALLVALKKNGSTAWMTEVDEVRFRVHTYLTTLPSLGCIQNNNNTVFELHRMEEPLLPPRPGWDTWKWFANC